LGLEPGRRLIVKWTQSPDTTIIPISNPSTMLRTGLQPPIDFSGAFTLAGGRVERTEIEPGEAISVTLIWQVGATPIETPAPGYAPPLAMFVHMVDSDPAHIVAQYDGWGAALTGLETGDVIVQHVTIPLPAAAPPGAYRVLAGLYSPQSMRRLTARLPGGASDRVELAGIAVR
jgi:hypothetical protein